MTFRRNSRVSGPADTVVGMRSDTEIQKTGAQGAKKPNEKCLSLNMKSVADRRGKKRLFLFLIMIYGYYFCDDLWACSYQKNMVSQGETKGQEAVSLKVSLDNN